MDKDKNIIKKYKGVTIALKSLGIGPKRLKYLIENNLLYNDKYYLSYAPVNNFFLNFYKSHCLLYFIFKWFRVLISLIIGIYTIGIEIVVI